MSDQNHTDYSCFQRALWWAKHHGYQMPAIEQAMFDGADAEPFRASLRMWATGLVQSHEFAKAMFGTDLVAPEHGRSFQAIKLWAKQVAVEHLGKIVKVDSERPYVELYTPPDVSFTYDAPKAPAELVDVERTTIQLRKIAAAIPIRTHELQDVDIIGGMPAWQYHLQQMVIADNPFLYLNEYLDKEMNRPHRADWRA